MDLFQAVVLGLLQGIAEWLPISSQGQVMVAGMQLFAVEPGTALGYAVFLHVGTLIAAGIYFRKEVVEIAKGRDRAMLKFIAIALVGSAVTAVPAYLFLKSAVQSPFLLMAVIGIALLFTGGVQLRKKISSGREDAPHGVVTGLAQGLAVIPGVSRSGITTSALLFQGFSPEKAFRLSFILSIPSVLLAEIAFGLAEGVALEAEVLVAVAVAALVGYASIAVLLRIAKRINFGLFCIGFGLVYLGLLSFKKSFK